MLICESICKIKTICSVYAKINELRGDIDIQVTDCKYSQTTTQQAMPINRPVTQPVGVALGSRSTEQINEVARQIKENSQEVPAPADDISCECESCKTMINVKHSYVCSVCKQVICGACATHSPTTDKPYCEKCWDELEPVTV